MEQSFTTIAEVVTDPAQATVYEHGWQSWSPAGSYPAIATSPRPQRPEWQTMGYRPGRPAPDDGFQGEGLLAVVPSGGPVTLVTAPDPWVAVPSVRAVAHGDRMVVGADGDVDVATLDMPLVEALAAYGSQLGEATGVTGAGTLPAGWCSWYTHWLEVCEDDILAALAAIERLDLNVGIVQVDDGHQNEIDDWLVTSPRFSPLHGLAGRIADSGRHAGIWTAPFLVGANSDLAAQHPDWLVGGAVAAPRHWEQQVGVLDVTHPQAAEHLVEVYRTLRRQGFDYHKIDFLYAGAMEGRRHADASPLDAYAQGLRLVREGVGDDSTILGCGAPLLPSVGRVDAMRISPDIDPSYEPADGDLSQPSQRAAVAAGRARAWMHGRLWINDPDCIVVRSEVERRDQWASYLDAAPGLRVSSDPLDALDDHGVALTRRLLRWSGPLA